MIRPPPRSTLFPSRRSSDLLDLTFMSMPGPGHPAAKMGVRSLDRKSTRLNSSHVSISYAVFCLKKKVILQQPDYLPSAPQPPQPPQPPPLAAPMPAILGNYT